MGSPTLSQSNSVSNVVKDKCCRGSLWCTVPLPPHSTRIVSQMHDRPYSKYLGKVRSLTRNVKNGEINSLLACLAFLRVLQTRQYFNFCGRNVKFRNNSFDFISSSASEGLTKTLRENECVFLMLKRMSRLSSLSCPCLPSLPPYALCYASRFEFIAFVRLEFRFCLGSTLGFQLTF